MKRNPVKPGAERRPFRPDTIRSFNVDAPATLLEFMAQAMPDRKRTGLNA